MDRKKQKYKKGFTLVELLVIIAIIGLLAIATLVSLNIARNKAAVNSYKTSMQSVRTALEACWVSGGSLVSGNAGVSLCSLSAEDAVYPELSKSCGAPPQFSVTTANQTRWQMTTVQSDDATEEWYCRGCRLECTTTECLEIEEIPGSGACR